jgi:hypothetical protein
LHWFVVNVVDDKVTGHVPEAQPADCALASAVATTPTATPQLSEKDKVLQAIPSHLSPAVKDIVHRYWHRFAPRPGLPPDRGIAHVIPEEPGARPVYRPPYRLSPAELAETEKQVKELLLQGLIEPSNSPYGAPILFVGKKDGTLRMCCDWRRLNSQTIKSRYPLPRIDHLLDQLQGSIVFSALDLTAGYHQILIRPEDVPKTAFTTPFGHYQFKVMSFGLCNAPATFQQAMNDAFRPLLNKGVLVYMDDILIHAKSAEHHAELLEEVMKLLTKHDYYCRLPKCEFEQKELKYLGHIVSGEGVKVNPAKTKVIEDWPQPTSVKQVRAFLGLANYFRKFVQGFSKLTGPLVRLTRKDVRWGLDTWTPECQQAFEGVQYALSHAPVLALPDFSKPMEVISDASITGMGAVLMQEGRPLAYESRRLTDAQVKWTTTEQELWAVYQALTVWRCYLEGLKFTVITDHNPLVHIPTQPNLSRKQARWVEFLQRFDFKWEYRPGRINVADPLSRMYEGASPEETAHLAKPAVLNAITLAVVTRSHKVPPPPPPNPPPPSKRKRKAERLTDSQLPVVASSQPEMRPSLDTDRALDPPAAVVTEDAPAETSPCKRQEVSEDNQLLELAVAGYGSDPWFADPKNLEGLEQRDGLWWHNNRLAVPNYPGLREAILYEYHDAAYSGHPGVAKTMRAIQQMYWWPAWRKQVERYVQTCASCQRNKASNQKPGGLMHPLPIPKYTWDSVSMDFIVQLPKTANKHDAVIVFVDRLSKMVHLAPTHTTVTAEGTARLFVDTVFRHHGIPKDIVTDRGSVFTGKFFQELLRLIGTKHNRTTAYHPQSDGQTERVNRVLEDMLRHYVGSLRHTDWDTCLATAEFAINNAYHESIGTTPFRMCYGKDPYLPLSLPTGTNVPSAGQFAQELQDTVESAKRCMQAAQQRQKAYYDAGRRDVVFTEGEEVLLSSKNLKLKRAGSLASTNKLMPKWIGPFVVIKVVGKGAYKLDLPPTMSQIHNVFHVSLLKPFRSDGRVQPPSPAYVLDDEEWFTIETILDHRDKNTRRKVTREYLVKWQGYGPEHNSWEPESELVGGPEFQLYWESLGLEPPVSNK